MQITYKDIEKAEMIKDYRYEPLKQMIMDTMGGKARVDILPIVFTARGVPSSKYIDTLQQLGICRKVGELTKKLQKQLFEDNKIIFDAWKRHSFMTWVDTVVEGLFGLRAFSPGSLRIVVVSEP